MDLYRSVFIVLMCILYYTDILRGVDSVLLTWTWIAPLLCPWTVDLSLHYRSGSLCRPFVWCRCVIRAFCCIQSIVQSLHIECAPLSKQALKALQSCCKLLLPYSILLDMMRHTVCDNITLSFRFVSVPFIRKGRIV